MDALGLSITDMDTSGPFTPEFLYWTLISLNLDTFIVANRVSIRKISRMAKCIDLDEVALPS